MTSVESDAPKSKDVLPPLVATPAPINHSPHSDDEPDRWASDNPDLIIASQPATCIYFNTFNQIVIIQESGNDDPDTFVRISPEFLGAVIKRLTAMLNEVRQ